MADITKYIEFFGHIHDKQMEALFDNWKCAQWRGIFAPIKANFCRNLDGFQGEAAQSDGARAVQTRLAVCEER